jgi:hypothetical protein
VEIRPEIVAEPFQILRRWSLYAATAGISLVIAVAVAAVASLNGPVWLWGLAALLLVVGLIALPGVADRDTPLMVADSHGVRLRDHGEWVGLLWSEIAQIVVEPRAGAQDPRVKVVTADGRRVYSTPVGFTTDVPVVDAEVQLARRRATNAY